VAYALADAGWWDAARAEQARRLGVRTIIDGRDVVLLDLRPNPR
jgi:hypothetical protein